MKFLKTSAARVLVGSRKTYSLPCTVCGTISEGTRRKKYCSAACRVKAARDRKKYSLRTSAAPFSAQRDNALAHQHLSEKPSGLSRASARRLANARAVVKGECMVCGKGFKATTRRRFCSANCRLTNYRLARKASIV